MIKLVSKGSWKKTENWLHKVSRRNPYEKTLQKYGSLGVQALRNNTPILTGATAESWYYEIEQDKDGVYKLIWANSNVSEEWFNIALYIQLGHATVDGHWIEGVDYINPALRPVFNELADKAWNELIQD